MQDVESKRLTPVWIGEMVTAEELWKILGQEPVEKFHHGILTRWPFDEEYRAWTPITIERQMSDVQVYGERLRRLQEVFTCVWRYDSTQCGYVIGEKITDDIPSSIPLSLISKKGQEVTAKFRSIDFLPKTFDPQVIFIPGYPYPEPVW